MENILCLVEADPFTASFSLTVEFLTYLFHKKQLVLGVVAGYRATIASAFKHIGLPDEP